VKITDNKPQQSWRDVLRIHPVADVFPMMNAAELQELADDIRKNGLQTPVSVWAIKDDDGNNVNYLIDGRNRLDAMEAAGMIQVDEYGHILDSLGSAAADRYFKWEFDEKASIAALVIAGNIRRRHLTAEQRATLAATALKAEEDFRRQKQATSAEQPAKVAPRRHRATGKPSTGRPLSKVGQVAAMTGVDPETARKSVRKVFGEGPSQRKPTVATKPKAKFVDIEVRDVTPPKPTEITVATVTKPADELGGEAFLITARKLLENIDREFRKLIATASVDELDVDELAELHRYAVQAAEEFTKLADQAKRALASRSAQNDT
jgi:ParB-like nuclease domain